MAECFMIKEIQTIGCIIMASGLSERYGKNKLLEKLDGREIILHTAASLAEAGLSPLAVTRSSELKAILDREGVACILHNRPKKSDTMHIGMENLPMKAAGYLFMPGDQPLVRPASLRKMAERFFLAPRRAVRLGYGEQPGSPVLFPASCREDLLAYEGDRGGMDVIRRKKIPCDIVQAEFEWELWDADTPERMERVREVYFRNHPGEEKNVQAL